MNSPKATAAIAECNLMAIFPPRVSRHWIAALFSRAITLNKRNNASPNAERPPNLEYPGERHASCSSNFDSAQCARFGPPHVLAWENAGKGE
jgi:hypothetical protein